MTGGEGNGRRERRWEEGREKKKKTEINYGRKGISGKRSQGW